MQLPARTFTVPTSHPFLPCAACVRSSLPCRSHTCIKELVQGQTFQRLLGYVFKDEGRGHFRNHLFGGISRQDVDAGKEEWTSLKLDYMQSKVALNKSNIFNRMHAFSEMMPETQAMSFSETIALAINSGKYMIQANMFCAQGGMMRAESAEAYWRIIHGERATGLLVQKILFMKEFSTRYFNQRVDNDGPFYQVQQNPNRDLGDFVPLGDGVVMEERNEPPRASSSSSSSSSVEVVGPKNKRTGWQAIQGTLRKRARSSARRRYIVDEAECDDDEDADEDEEGDERDSDFVVSDHVSTSADESE